MGGEESKPISAAAQAPKSSNEAGRDGRVPDGQAKTTQQIPQTRTEDARGRNSEVRQQPETSRDYSVAQGNTAMDYHGYAEGENQPRHDRRQADNQSPYRGYPSDDQGRLPYAAEQRDVQGNRRQPPAQHGGRTEGKMAYVDTAPNAIL